MLFLSDAVGFGFRPTLFGLAPRFLVSRRVSSELLSPPIRPLSPKLWSFSVSGVDSRRGGRQKGVLAVSERLQPLAQGVLCSCLSQAALAPPHPFLTHFHRPFPSFLPSGPCHEPQLWVWGCVFERGSGARESSGLRKRAVREAEFFGGVSERGALGTRGLAVSSPWRWVGRVGLAVGRACARRLSSWLTAWLRATAAHQQHQQHQHISCCVGWLLGKENRAVSEQFGRPWKPTSAS